MCKATVCGKIAVIFCLLCTPGVFSLPSWLPQPFARYRAQDWNPTTRILPDSSGNGRDSQFASGVITQTQVAGNGASVPVPAIHGSRSSHIRLAAGTIPVDYTLCTLTRYDGPHQERILSTTTNWLHGHHSAYPHHSLNNGCPGCAYYAAWGTGTHPDTLTASQQYPKQDWLVLCGQDTSWGATGGTFIRNNEAPFAAPATWSSTATLEINMWWSQQSEWAVSEIIVWDSHLSIVEMQAAHDYLLSLKTGSACTCAQNAQCVEAACQCYPGMHDVYGNASLCVDIDECLDEAKTSVCHSLASCVNNDGSFACECQTGFLGDGTECVSNAWGVRSVFEIAEVSSRRSLTSDELQRLRQEYAALVLGIDTSELSMNASIVAEMPTAFGSLHYGTSFLAVVDDDAEGQITLIALFVNKTDAESAVASLASKNFATYWDLLDSVRTIVDGPEVYRWVAPTTSAPVETNPTGLTVDRVYFEPSCLDNGCWKVDVTYTAGTDNFNVFYIPKTDGNDDLSYDQSYDTVTTPWTISPEATFLPANHPCTSADYAAAVDPSVTPASVTMCCIPQFLSMYRPVQTFEDAFSPALMSAIMNNCTTSGTRSRGITRADIPVIAKRGQAVGGNVYERPIAPVIEGVSGDLFQAEEHGIFAHGRFQDLISHMNSTGSIDQYVGIYTATLYLDEKELRTMAGQLMGTVGIEHTVNTFVGLAEFSPTGTFVVDPFVTQINIQLEKTSFFTVSTHGTNDYTFLEYVNMRLVATYNEDTDFSSTSESASRTVRTSSALQANYVQVTFTLGAQYNVDPAGSPLIQLDSVRAGHGTFFDDADLVQHCSEWDDSNFVNQAIFNTTLTQQCAPNAAMCVSPASIPDSFVVFNIPLGVDYFENDAGGTSTTLANNVFVDMVISAAESGRAREDSSDPNSGGDPQQMKTTLTASIPIVEGGVNVFCDGFTAKTDLKDVANADIVVGSASSAEELTRLRIMTDITSSQLDAKTITRIDSDSIEAGLMTLVLKGNNSYFLANTGRDEVTIELEDVITIHIMEDDGSGRDDSTGKDGFVAGLLAQAPDDNTDANGLDTDGYNLNGAFYFTIDRAAQRAHLEPSPTLLAECPFNPPRPVPGALPLQTCVTRRDVRFRGFPARTGATSTAMELCNGPAGSEVGLARCPAADDEDSDEALFMSTILGNNEYARKLGSNYARVIAAAYKLNNRYRRAYFINPGYEWTPTQTGGTAIFSVSQKLYLFALITLDEGLTSEDTSAGAGAMGADVTLPSYRRRMLLQSTPSNVGEALQDGESTTAGGVFEFQTTPSQMMAKAFDVPQDRVATFTVKLRLTQAEACMSETELQASIREMMVDYLQGVASPHKTVQVTKMTVNKAGVHCARRSIRSLLTSFSEATAEVTMLVVFEEGQDSIISLEKLSTMAGITSVEPLSVSEKVTTDAPETYVPPPPSSKKSDGADSHAEGASSSNIAVIAGAAAGGAVFVIAGILGIFFMRKRQPGDHEVMHAVQTVNIEDLKSQISADA